MCAAQAIDLDPNGKMAKGTQVVYDQVRGKIDSFMEDRETYRDMKKMYDLIQTHDIVEAVEAAIGPVEGKKN